MPLRPPAPPPPPRAHPPPVQTKKFGKIAAGASVTHTAVVVPGTSAVGTFNFQGAKVSYATVEGGEAVVSRSSAAGKTEVLSRSLYARQYSTHLVEWAMFAGLCFVPIGIPYLKYSSKAKLHE